MATYAAEQAPVRWPAASADIPILASKITVPGVPDWTVPRPRITKLIAEGTRWCPLTVVTGPPGAGKTMALALWAAAEAGRVAWVSLDDYDNQPGAFWAYVTAALRQAVDAGWRTRQDVKDVGAGQLAAVVEDSNGNMLGFLQR